MSGYYAKVEEGFDAFCLDIPNLKNVLKREVRIVQGVRSRCDDKTKLSNEPGVEMNETHSLNTEFNGLQAGEGDCDTAVLKMECKAYKLIQQPSDPTNAMITSELNRAFMVFCCQHGIPYLPQNASENDEIYTKHNNGEQKASGNPKQGGSKDSGKSHRESNSSSKGNPTESRSPAQAGAGGAGGGRPPSDSSSSPFSDFSISTVNIVSETSPNPSITSLASTTLPRTRTKKFRKQKSVRVSGEKEAPIQMPKQKPLPPLSAAPSLVSIASTSILTRSDQSPRKPKTVKIKADSADREHLQIRTFSVTGKKQKTANLNQKSISVKKINQKEFALPPAQKSKKIVNLNHEHENLFEEIPPQKMKASIKPLPATFQMPVAPSAIPIPQTVDPPNMTIQKPKESRIYKLKRHRHHHHRPSFYKKFASTQNLKKEKGNEWLSWSTSDESVDEDAEDKEKNRDPKVKERPIDPDLQAFTSSVSHLNQLNNILGLNPYKRVLRSNKCVHVKWQTKSWEFFGVCCNAIIFSMCTLSILRSFLFIFNLEAPYSFSK
ncbi:unnamed protein product [Orchesella dallaii]|uniref:Uncharacterized protein n=1 Tax=Orchesella dallaii TaxID=48710 RepID=A0ABP1R6L3_9HEXA